MSLPGRKLDSTPLRGFIPSLGTEWTECPKKAYAGDEESARACAASMNDFIIKPIDPNGCSPSRRAKADTV